MNTTNTKYIGIDISKERLDVCIPDCKASSYPNKPGDIQRLVKAIQAVGSAVHVIMEPTGGYERELAHALWAVGIPLTLANPRQVRNFARSCGQLAKTDKIDAYILSEFGYVNQPQPSQAPSPEQEQLAHLVTRRNQLLVMQNQEENHVENETDKAVLKQSRQLLNLIKKQIDELKEMIANLIENNAPMKAKAARMKEIKYVGEVTVSTLLAFMPELGTLTDRQAGALTGVAPINRDSGGMRGHRFITAGRGKVRRVLYMVAMGLSKHNAFMKARYDRMKANGKPTKVAFVAIMRHLIILINRMIKNPDFVLQKTP